MYKLQKKKKKKYIVTIMCDETQIQIVLKSKLTKKQLYDVLCKMYDEFNLCEINETSLIFDFSYVVTNTITHEQLKRCYYANNKCC